ncbi:hypothetical protein M422DRAFT_236175 [Sphaerobolus stellatus SS14]|uniref:Uncharacterized protein n=1 Tax=Sphaerobolus stellatus (strain SS14) TaxID=990650 RepID=A0A0C9TDE8_SPHS4|nr:hypothetical protein M422DRAFT_236175 [Sphaerobolus stellatus SS14]
MTVISADGSRTFPREDLYDPYRSERFRLTPRVINNLMVRAIAFRRPDVVFRLWDMMSHYYVTEPSLGTLTVLIIAARMAASMDSSLTLFIPRWLQGDVFFTRPQPGSFSEEMEQMLSNGYRPRLLWHNEYPWRLVRHIIREEILFSSWPHLRYVDIPAHPVHGDEATGRMEAYRELKAQESLVHLSMERTHKYPHLMPTQDTFRKYILLLGRVNRCSEIPEVLAWMKALDVVPSKGTLAIALAHWSQVASDAPIDEYWNERRSAPHLVGRNFERTTVDGEYHKLVAWMVNWVGKDDVPQEAEILAAFTHIRKLDEKERHIY